MAEIARPGLALLLGREVLDQTGLEGHFDADVVFTPASQRVPPAAPFIGPAFFSAVEEQLGLKLDLQTGPVDMLVIDHVEKPAP
jgi:uncharacterized protein (TIGR03435 family)